MNLPVLLDCGHPENPAPSKHTTGYGTDMWGEKICLDCCNARTRLEIYRGLPLFGYLSEDQKRVTGWHGETLLTVKECWRSYHPVPNYRGFRPHQLMRVRAIDQWGREWHGTGPTENGTYVRMRICKRFVTKKEN